MQHGGVSSSLLSCIAVLSTEGFALGAAGSTNSALRAAVPAYRGTAVFLSSAVVQGRTPVVAYLPAGRVIPVVDSAAYHTRPSRVIGRRCFSPRFRGTMEWIGAGRKCHPLPSVPYWCADRAPRGGKAAGRMLSALFMMRLARVVFSRSQPLRCPRCALYTTVDRGQASLWTRLLGDHPFSARLIIPRGTTQPRMQDNSFGWSGPFLVVPELGLVRVRVTGPWTGGSTAALSGGCWWGSGGCCERQTALLRQ